MAPRAKQRSCSVCTLPVLSVLFDEDLIKLYYHPFFTIDNHFGVPSWDSLPTNSFDSDLLALSRHWERELTYILSVIPAPGPVTQLRITSTVSMQPKTMKYHTLPFNTTQCNMTWQFFHFFQKIFIILVKDGGLS